MSVSAAAAALCAPGRRRVPAVVWDAVTEAKLVRDAADAEARTIVAAALKEAEQIHVAAAVAGRDEGLVAAAETLGRAALERDRMLAACEGQVVELAFEIASRVLALSVERDRDAAVEVTSRALQAVRNHVDLTVRAHPDDIGAIRSAEPQLLEAMTRARRIAIVADASVGRGGAIVETEAASIDARLTTQLEGLRRALDVSAT